MRRMKRQAALCLALLLVLPAVSAGAQEEGMKSLGAKTIVPPSPVWVIGSYDKAGSPNMMTASWVGVCCSNPPMVAISLRKATYTYGNIVESKAYTVNIPSGRSAVVAAYAGTVSGRDTDKFRDTGLTPVKSALVNAPYIKEFPLVVECELFKTIELGLHTMFIGKIIDVKADSKILGKNGTPDPEKLQPFIFSYGGWGFYEVGEHIGTVGELSGKIKGKKQ